MDVLRTGEDCFVVDDDLLNFNLEEGFNSASSFGNSYTPSKAAFGLETQSGSYSEVTDVEEDLEWLSNKDAFPTVETCFGILADNPGLITYHHSPISVLENSSGNNNNTNVNSVASFRVPTNHPVRSRSIRKTRKRTIFSDLPIHHWPQELALSLPPSPTKSKDGGSMGRRCLHCQADKTPQWRAGPMGPKTLCNACGVRYKSGRLLPEYRPANSPTFSNSLHSNSHKKVVEMRKQKQGQGDALYRVE